MTDGILRKLEDSQSIASSLRESVERHWKYLLLGEEQNPFLEEGDVAPIYWLNKTDLLLRLQSDLPQERKTEQRKIHAMLRLTQQLPNFAMENPEVYVGVVQLFTAYATQLENRLLE